MLLEDGDELLLESGDAFVTEAGPTSEFGQVTLVSLPLAPLDVGDRPLCTATFTDSDDVAAVPSLVTFTWRTPDGAVTEFVYGVDDDIDVDGPGVFLFLAPTIATHGLHVVRVVGSEGVIAAAELHLGVRRASVRST